MSRVIPSGASRVRFAPAEALALVQVGAAVVLWHSPLLLVVASIVIAAVSAIVSRRVGAEQSLAPMSLGAVSFALVIAFGPQTPGLAALPLLATWAMVFVVTAVDFAPVGSITSKRAGLAAVPLGAFALLATQLDARSSPAINALTLAAVALVAGWLAARATRPAIALAFAVATGALVVATAARFGGDAPAALLVASGVWALAAALPALRAAAVDARDAVHVGWEAPFAAAIGAVGFAAAAYFTTRPQAEALRAALLGGDAIVTLALALHASERRDDSDAAALFGGLALALGAIAIAFACQGATITVLWAVLAALRPSSRAARIGRRGRRSPACCSWRRSGARSSSTSPRRSRRPRASWRHAAPTACSRPLPSSTRARSPSRRARSPLLVAARATWGMREGAAVASSPRSAVTGSSSRRSPSRSATRPAPTPGPARPARRGDAAWTDFLVAL